ncbi:MAG: carboxypeptidase regulatory-like domain-containing protein [Acidobacteria bacterium]|nr:carboxypeptidase regulatory-like domain-containing protein [Acidobacteriota bacterium]
MLRRSAPALLGLFVCLLAAHLSSAAPAFRLDESRVRLSLDSDPARARVEVENGTGRDLPARLRVELVDPHDKVRAAAATDVRLRRGPNALDVALEFHYAELSDAERKEFPWYRLRYSVAPTSATTDAPPALEGVASLSEVAPDLFELSVISAPAARPGSHYMARARTANPVNARPLKGVAVEAKMTFEEKGDKKTALKASGTTDGEGFVTLDFELPRGLHPSDDEAELEVTARRGVLVEQAEAEVSVEEKPRVLLTTDKPLYQPGQTVHMRALVFDQSGHALEGEEVTFKVEDEDDSTAFSADLKTSRFGVAAADWRVPESTKLGSYTLKLEMDDKYDIDYGARTDFRLSRYDLPNFSVTAKADRPYYLAGESPSVEVRADYLFGQPVKRGRVRVVRQTERRWNYKEQKYETEEHPAVEGELREGVYVARLDLKDEYKELAESGYERFRDLDFAAYVTDPTTKRTEQRRFELRLTKDPVHLYVSEGRYRQAKGLPVAFYLATFYADGTPAECDVTIYEEGATETRRGEDGRVHEVTDADRVLVNVHTNRYGVAKVSGPAVRRDETRQNIPLRFVARDRSGRAGHHSEDFWLGYYRSEVPEIRVETDKTIYAPGEPVRVELSSDAERMAVVVDAVSEGRVLYSRSARLSGGRAALVIPTGPEFAGVVSVTATSAAPTKGGDEGSFANGARTVVFPRDRELKLDVKLSQKSFRPGEEAGAQFAVRTADGRRAAGALGVVVFDKAVEERARTDGEAGRGFGFGNSFIDYWYGYWNIAGVTRRDVERLDPARTRPEGFDVAAEMLYNNERPEDFHRVTTGTNFEREQSRVFADLVAAELKPLTDALNTYYAGSLMYPTGETALVQILAPRGVDFKALRDPWGQPFRPRFSVVRVSDRLELLSSGADKLPDTDDDFVAATFNRPYFRKTGEAIDRAAAAYHKRTGGFIRDLATLREELRNEKVGGDALLDPWGQPYRFHFETSGTHNVIIVESSGPDRVFAPSRGASGSDDFDVWNLLTDYFKESREALDGALEKNAREGRAFPRTRAELASALANSSLSLDGLRDGWGRPVYVTFSTLSRFTDRVEVTARGADLLKRSARPVTQTVRTLTLRSAGPDGREGTPDDFTLAYHTSIGDEQTAQDAAPVPAAQTTTFSGGTGAITGTVLDPNGAAIAHAKVVAKHGFVEFEASAETNDEGVYLLRNLPSGVYTVTFNADGFSQMTIEAVRVISSNLTKLDASMAPAAMTETVTVTAGDSSTQTSTQFSATVVKSEGGPVVQAPLSTPRLREFFPETLVWSPELETAGDGTARLNFKLADNITTWKMSVIASTEDGRLGTAEQEFLSFQPFFVEHDPPRVLTEGDEISLPVVLRNYLSKPQGVDVEMKPESWFALSGASRQRAEVPAGDAARPTFDFRAVASVNDGKQRVTALGADASDAIEKPVTVHPDGEERSLTDGTLLTDAGALAVNVPADALRGSLRGELKVYPNLTAHVLEGVEAIMSRPYGCAEQTISSAYPSVLVLNYSERLKGGGLDPAVVVRARKYAQLGYERLLGYRAPGGGFTYWGRGEADLALTAYALRFLTDVSRVIEVDQNVIAETRDWLVKQQRPDGSWPAHTWGDHEDKMRTALTTVFIARVLAATQKTESVERAPVARQTPAPTAPTQTTPAKADAAKEQATPLKRALAYAAARAEEADEPYLVASLALAAADAGETALAAREAARLRALAHEEGAGTYWALETNTPFYGWGLAGRVETTALAVQALNRSCGMPDAGCGSKDVLVERGLDFLLRKKDRYGVWYSTQATINVFDALLSAVAARGGAGGAQEADVAEVFVNGRSAGRLTLPPPDRLTGPLTLDLTPFLAAGGNRVELKRRAQATNAQAQLVTTFYVPWGARAGGGESAEGTEAQKRGAASALKLSVGYDHTDAGVSEEVTCSVSAERVGHMGYGMLLAEVGLPPGADVDRASLERAAAESDWSLDSYDVLPDRLVVYLWPRGGGTRFKFKFRPRYGLKALTAPSQLYDYYNPEARTVVAPTRFVVR